MYTVTASDITDEEVCVLHQDLDGEWGMVIMKRLRFRHIWDSLCLAIILIDGIASAAVGLHAPVITNDSSDSIVHQKCRLLCLGV